MADPDLVQRLENAGVEYELLHHRRTESAIAEAVALGVPLDEVAKTLVVNTPSGHVRAVIPASRRIDLRKLGEVIGESRKSLELASEEELGRDYPEFELGAVPPIGGAHRDRVVVDRALAARDSVVLEAGAHDDSIRLRTADLLRLTEAQVADVCRDYD